MTGLWTALQAKVGMSRAALWMVPLAVATVVRVGLANHLGVLADEAYYAVWSVDLAWGYYDQPPVIAWLIAATDWMAPGALGLRAGALLCGVVGSLALALASRDRALGALWFTGVPVLFGLTLVQTADAPLLAAWAVCLAAAVAGGRWWLLAGVAGAVAGLSKYTGILVFPLCLAAAGPKDWRAVWPWLGLGGGLALLVPHLTWLTQHDGVSVRHVVRENLWTPQAMGLWGPVRVLGEQGLVVGPVLVGAGLWWAATHARWVLCVTPTAATRATRMALATSVPVALGFGLASTVGVSEAHWPAPATVGLGLGLAWTEHQRLRLAAWVGLGMGTLATALAAIHVVYGVFPLDPDPADPFYQGQALSEQLAPRVGTVLPVYTERYQEAAWIAYYAKRPAWHWPSCGRPDEYTLRGVPRDVQQAWFVRPYRSGPVDCVGPTWRVVGEPMPIQGRTPGGRGVGRWDLVRIQKTRPK